MKNLIHILILALPLAVRADTWLTDGRAPAQAGGVTVLTSAPPTTIEIDATSGPMIVNYRTATNLIAELAPEGGGSLDGLWAVGASRYIATNQALEGPAATDVSAFLIRAGDAGYIGERGRHLVLEAGIPAASGYPGGDVQAVLTSTEGSFDKAAFRVLDPFMATVFKATATNSVHVASLLVLPEAIAEPTTSLTLRGGHNVDGSGLGGYITLNPGTGTTLEDTSSGGGLTISTGGGGFNPGNILLQSTAGSLGGGDIQLSAGNALILGGQTVQTTWSGASSETASGGLAGLTVTSDAMGSDGAMNAWFVYIAPDGAGWFQTNRVKVINGRVCGTPEILP